MVTLTKEELFKKAQKHFKKGKNEKTIKTVNKILKLSPDDIESYFLKIHALFNLDKIDEISKTLNDFFKNMSFEDDYFSLIYLLLELNLKEETIDVYNQAIKKFKNPIDFIVGKFLTMESIGLDDDAIKFLDKLIDEKPGDKNLLLLKSNYYKSKSEYDESIKLYDEILKSDNDLDVIARKVKTLKILKKDEEAIDILNQMISNDNNKNWALAQKGLYYIGLDNEKAFEIIDNAIEEDSKNQYALISKAALSLQLDDYNDYVENMVKVQEIDEDIFESPDVYILQAKFLFEMQEYEKALGCLSLITYLDWYNEESIKLIEKITDIEENGSIEEIARNEGFKIARTIFYKNSNKENIKNLIYSKYFNNQEMDELRKEEDVELYDDIPEEKNLKSIEDYAEAINDFEKLKGKEYFKEHTGHFWKLAEARPYVMWVFDYSTLLWEEGKKEESIKKLRYLLELNDEDNIGAGDVLICKLLELNELDEANEFLNQHLDDAYSCITYSFLLHAIKSFGDESMSNDFIKELFKFSKKTNPFIPDFLLSNKSLDIEMPENYIIGDENEAIYYSKLAFKSWNDDKNALKILKDLNSKF